MKKNASTSISAYHHRINEEYLSIFAKYLFNKYVKQNGYALSKIDKHAIPIVCSDAPPQFYEKHPSYLKPITSHYFCEMKSRGYLTEDGGFFKLTIDGYHFGYKSLHPFKYFLRNNWRSIIDMCKIFISVLSMLG